MVGETVEKEASEGRRKRKVEKREERVREKETEGV